jgi:hypothetical protein
MIETVIVVLDDVWGTGGIRKVGEETSASMTRLYNCAGVPLCIALNGCKAVVISFAAVPRQMPTFVTSPARD